MQLSLSNLSTKDLAALSQRNIAISDEADFADVKDNPLLAAVKTVYQTYDSIYTPKVYGGKSNLLFDAHRKRDITYYALKDILGAHARLSSSPYHQAAAHILRFSLNTATI